MVVPNNPVAVFVVAVPNGFVAAVLPKLKAILEWFSLCMCIWKMQVDHFFICINIYGRFWNSNRIFQQKGLKFHEKYFSISLPQWCASPAPSPLGFASSQVQVRSLEKLTKSSQAFAFRRSFVKYGTNLLFDLFMTNTDYQHFTRYPNIFQWKRIYFMYIEADDNCQIRWVFKFFEVSLSWPEDLPLWDLRHAFPRGPSAYPPQRWTNILRIHKN